MPQPRDVALYRAAMRDVAVLAQQALLGLWGQLDPADAAGVSDGLQDTLPGLVENYHVIASTVAADFYDLQRAHAGVRKRFTAVQVDPPDAERARVLARWGASPLFSADPAISVAISKLAGGLQRVVIDGARDTIVGSAVKDPARVGWERVGAGGCDWCAELLTEGVIYSEDAAAFDSHDHCNCTAVPAF